MDWLAKKFELSRGEGASNVRPMEGLRGFAVFLVFVVHFVTLGEAWAPNGAGFAGLIASLHTIGNTGVDLFFVLSGYLIYGSLLSRRQTFGYFLSRRIERIYPAFIVVFIIYVGLSFVFPGERKIPSETFDGSIYLLQNFLLLPGLFPIEPMITVAWSLSYEMFYYLAVPLLIMACRLREWRVHWRVGLFSAIAGLFAIYCAIYGGHIRLLMFISGILLFEAKNSRLVSSPGSGIGFFSLAGGLLLTLIPFQGAAGDVLKTGILFFAFPILCFVCFRSPSTWLPHLFSWRPMRWLGNMSYSYYLLHGLALKAAFFVLAKVLPPDDYGFWLFWILLPVMFALTLFPATMLFVLVERPFSLMPEKSRSVIAVRS